MNEFINEPTAEARVVAYIRSNDFLMDIDALQNTYAAEGKTIPPLSQLKQEALSDFLSWLALYEQCEAGGHAWIETADAENGHSDLV